MDGTEDRRDKERRADRITTDTVAEAPEASGESPFKAIMKREKALSESKSARRGSD